MVLSCMLLPRLRGQSSTCTRYETLLIMPRTRACPAAPTPMLMLAQAQATNGGAVIRAARRCRLLHELHFDGLLLRHFVLLGH